MPVLLTIGTSKKPLRRFIELLRAAGGGGAAPAMTDLVLLAVTRMLSGVCIGGIPPGGGPWVRPVKAFGCPQLGDIRFAGGALMRPFDIVALHLLKPQPDPPHVED